MDKAYHSEKLFPYGTGCSCSEDQGRPGNPEASRGSAYLFHVFRIVLGAVFLYASYDKILHPGAFAQVVYNYQLLPESLINLVAITLPWLELILGLCLVAGCWLPGATVVSTGLLTVFIGALVFNAVRGLDTGCGCFSTESSHGAVDWWTVARDIGFLAISAVVMVYSFSIRPAGLNSRKP